MMIVVGVESAHCLKRTVAFFFVKLINKIFK